MTDIPIDEQKRIFSANLQRYIRISGKEQKQICSDLGINESTFSQWVNGLAIPRNVSTIRKLADYFNVGMTKLINPEPEDDSAADIAQALEVYKKYKNALPQVQEIVLNLVRSSRSDS